MDPSEEQLIVDVREISRLRWSEHFERRNSDDFDKRRLRKEVKRKTKIKFMNVIKEDMMGFSLK